MALGQTLKHPAREGEILRMRQVHPPSASAHEQQRLEQIERARQAVLLEGRVASDAAVNPWPERTWLAQSWRRCLTRGLRPDQAVVFDLVSRPASQQLREAHRELLQAARGPLQQLARAVAPIRYFALLTDADGTVIDTAGTIDHGDRRAHAIARIGVDLSEHSIGTSAIGAALREQQPVWLHRGEHFFRDTGAYSCAGAPLAGPDGRCVGMLDLTGIDAPERPELKHLVAQSARQIEDALLLATPHRWCLRLGWSPAVAADGLLCLDADGFAVGANAAARHMLPTLRRLSLQAIHVESLFALPCGMLFDHATSANPLDAPLWSGLRASVLVRPAGGAAPVPAARPLKLRETELIHQAVREAGGNVARAARTLGLSRATVYRRLAAVRKD